MLGVIAGQGGFDPKGKTAVSGKLSTTSTAYVTFLSVNGSGYLTGIGACSDNSRTYINIIIDGTAREVYCGRYVGGTGFSPMYRFESSLIVQAKTTAVYVHASAVALVD